MTPPSGSFGSLFKSPAILILDEIAVVLDGRITERGTHEELMAQGGKYKKLYSLQFRDTDYVE